MNIQHDKEQLTKQLLDWYKQNARVLPWREKATPYRVWVSEIMLQQTTTEAVIPYYKRFLTQFPTIHDLSQSSLEDVYKLWEGLGYYRRAKHIYETALYIEENYQGHFPTQYQDIISLKGIGPYTAGAICSIAYNLPTPAVDGNVLRIISRYKLIRDNIALSKTHKQITKIVEQLLIGYNPSDFNQALMDLGATICKPQNPLCHQCPINTTCLAFQNNQQKVLPINIKNIKHQDHHFITGVISYQDQIMMIKNTQGLLENLYGCIQYECESPYTFIEQFNNEYHQNLIVSSHINDIKHVFTHKTWYMHVYHFILQEPNTCLYKINELHTIPISTAHQKVIKSFKDLNQ